VDVLILGLGMLLARALGEVIFILSARVYNTATIGFANDLRTMTYDKVQKLSMTSLAKRTPGDLIRRIMEDTTTIKDFMADAGRWAVEQSIMFVVVMTILLLTNPGLTLLVFLPVPIVMVVLSRFWKFIRIRYERQWRKSSQCQSILHDIIRGIRTVKAFGNEEIEIAKFSKVTRELAEVQSNNEVLWSLLFPSITFFTGIGEFLVLYFGGKGILNGTMSIGVLTQFVMYIGFIYAPLRWLVSFPRWLADAMTSMVKVFEILDEEPDIAEKDSVKNVPVSGNVAFDGVTFGYKSYEPVLKDVSLTINPGEMVGIVGRSGTNTDYYPDVFIGQDLPREALSCYSRPVLRESFNCETAVFCDMESAGIIEVAKKFTYAHQVAIVKIISDYLTHYIGREKIFSI
jgi:ATP-binding cassette subfamily B protein